MGICGVAVNVEQSGNGNCSLVQYRTCMRLPSLTMLHVPNKSFMAIQLIASALYPKTHVVGAVTSVLFTRAWIKCNGLHMRSDLIGASFSSIQNSTCVSVLVSHIRKFLHSFQKHGVCPILPESEQPSDKVATGQTQHHFHIGHNLVSISRRANEYAKQRG